MRQKLFYQGIKGIGLAVFLWILITVDRQSVMGHIRQADGLLLMASFIVLTGTYIIKAIRWHLLVRLYEGKHSLKESWEIYIIGVFLSVVTPAKLGEFGRIAYLVKGGMKRKEAITLTLVDRALDGVVIGCVALAATAVLFGKDIFIALITGLLVLLGIAAFVATRKRMVVWGWKLFPKTPVGTAGYWSGMLLLTTLSWSVYFLWTLTLAAAVGIRAPAVELISAFTMAGIVAMLPVAPSGLGTRDAALIWLLGPYGVTTEQAVSLGVLMFLSILFSGLLGSYYFLRGVR